MSDTAHPTRDDLLGMSKPELRAVLQRGFPIKPGDLDDTEYLGISLGLPRLVDRLFWKTFQKVFHRDPQTGHLRGWNVKLMQTGIDGEITPRLQKGTPVTWGHYRVVDPADRVVPLGCDRGLLIDYGLGQNPALQFLSRLRDPLVAVREGRVDVLLGWTYVDLGLLRVGTPSYFLLERRGTLSYVPKR